MTAMQVPHSPSLRATPHDTLVANDEPFQVCIEGDATAPAVMFSNSLGTSFGIWNAQAESLGRHFRTVRYNPRGFHPESAASGDFSVEAMGRDALSILDALEIKSVTWCGVSMGGAVGLWLMLNAPERIERAVIANAAPFFGGAANWSHIDAVRAAGLADVAKGTSQRVLSPAFRERHPEVVEALRAQVASVPVAAWAGCAAALRDLDLREQIAAIRHRVLLIGGTHDLTTPWATTLALHAQLPDSSLIQLNAAHLSNVECAAEFTAATNDFLR
ncbi:MAG: alpha/beta fold hydrolase [Oxalobacteraceae bacterium]|nr:MAG: alpha/beta fold hydrolase [Oxalobacteraceae bacterium]